MSTPDGGVVVTSDQIYKQLQDVASAVSRMEGKLDTLADHEKRLRALEDASRKSWPLPAALTGGAAAAVAAVWQAMHPGQ